MHDTLFYFCAGLLLLFSTLVVTVPNLLHAAISLIASFLVTTCLYIMFKMEFVALAQIMIYIGGIVIFIIITILLTAQLGGRNLYPKTLTQRLWGFAISGSLLALLLPILRKAGKAVGDQQMNPPAASLEQIGLRLLDTSKQGFIVPFEVISLLLLISLIGAVVIARRDKKEKGEEEAQ